MMEIARILIHLLLFLIAVAEAGDSLNPRSGLGVHETLLSNNSKYEVRFWRRKVSSDYYLVISFAFDPKDDTAITWTVRTPCLNEVDCKLMLCRQRGLVINGTNWTSGANGKLAHIARLTNEGNLIVLGRNGDVLWESFNHPTNTLLPGQKMKLSQSLIALPSPDYTDYNAFKLGMERDIGITLYEKILPASVYSVYFAIKTSVCEGCLYAQLDMNGRFNLVLDGPQPQTVAYWNSIYHGNTSVDNKVYMGYGVPGMYTWDGNTWQSSWDSTFTLCLQDLVDPSLPEPVPKPKKGSKGVKHFSIYYSVGIFILGVGLSYCMWKIIKNKKEAISLPFSESAAPTRFGYRALKIATRNFSEKLGGGDSGCVYKGKLRNNTLVAVKVLDRSKKGEKEFEAEVMTIGSIHHVNLVRLIGFCSEGKHRRLLVYEYMENGSLDKHLFSTTSVLPWLARFNIALGIARGMNYCHDHCRSRIVHCDLKPQNVLLDTQLLPKISDFGLAKLMSRGQSYTLTDARGTRGYLAPEWMNDVPITVKADVYSYGQMLLEVISGRKNFLPSASPSKQYYPQWSFKETLQGNIENVSDPRLGSEVDLQQVELLVKVAFWCIQGNSVSRPSMEEVVRMIEGSVDVLMPPYPNDLSFQVNLLSWGDDSE